MGLLLPVRNQLRNQDKVYDNDNVFPGFVPVLCPAGASFADQKPLMPVAREPVLLSICRPCQNECLRHSNGSGPYLMAASTDWCTHGSRFDARGHRVVRAGQSQFDSRFIQPAME